MYTVPVIPPDLRHEETIIQAAIALDCLHQTINSVFDRIDSRTERNNAKLKELSTRIEKAQSKIRCLVGTKKAIKIYAPARFPSSQIFRDIPQTFTDSIAMVEQHAQQQHNQKSIYEVHSGVDAPATLAQQEKLVFFHVRYKDSYNPMHGSTVAADKSQVNKSIGMGVVPHKLRSVSSLLHCNSDELVYGNEHAEKDVWKKAKFFKSPRQRRENSAIGEQKQLLEPAPYSLAHRNQKVNSFGGLRYTPRLHEAPEIDLPLDLPDLPGIADDIYFEGNDQQQIAPSLYIENLPDLPELEEANVDIKKNLTGEPVIVHVPPPPPPPLSSIAPTTVTNIANSIQVGGVAPQAPPPPPPPPLMPSLTQAKSANEQILKVKSTSVAVSKVNTDNSRNELMDAIRKAGGARGGRLRAAAAAPVDVVDNRLGNKNSDTKLKTSASGGGDLMADLHNKLLMRRKGISGAKDRENTNSVEASIEKTNVIAITAGNPVMSRLSALIPAPTGTQKQSDDDEDDDNENEWIEE
ncbi:WASH complex subunit 1 [Eurosta solidaginis]|uniref:WASH complex subunit 1 n=1 Tax=Eurosta solidaginis TaxID=178769 RepID=UPI0035310B05